MGAYKFIVTDIEWEEGEEVLPDEVTVLLSKWLVEAEVIDDDEWDDAIQTQLQAEFGRKATSFGLEPAD